MTPSSQWALHQQWVQTPRTGVRSPASAFQGAGTLALALPGSRLTTKTGIRSLLILMLKFVPQSDLPARARLRARARAQHLHRHPVRARLRQIPRARAHPRARLRAHRHQRLASGNHSSTHSVPATIQQCQKIGRSWETTPLYMPRRSAMSWDRPLVLVLLAQVGILSSKATAATGASESMSQDALCAPAALPPSSLVCSRICQILHASPQARALLRARACLRARPRAHPQARPQACPRAHHVHLCAMTRARSPTMAFVTTAEKVLSPLSAN